jgi:DNA polymerase III psi subunit
MVELCEMSIVQINDIIQANDKRFFIEMECETISASASEQRNVHWLLDCGAQITAISATCVKDRSAIRPLKHKFQAKSASGHDLNVLGMVQLSAFVGKRHIQFPAIVMDGLSTQAILGVDFIREQDVTIQGGTGTVLLRGTKTPTIAAVETTKPMGSKPPAVHVLRAPKTVQVMPMSGCVVEVHPRQPLEEGTLGLCSDPNHDTLVVEALQIVYEGNVKVNLHNPTQRLITIPAGEPVAFFQKVSETEVVDLAEVTAEFAEVQPVPSHEQVQEKLQFMAEKLNFRGNTQWKAKYWELICKYQHVFSAHKYDLGRTDAVKHSIACETKHRYTKSNSRCRGSTKRS